jgi:hypothetical protein
MSDEELFALLNEREQQEWLALSDEEKAGVRDLFTQRIPPTDELRVLTQQLFDRVRHGDGRILRRQNFEGAQIHECFDNAVAWVAAHPGDRLAFGFIYFDSGYRFPHVRFTPHVAVLTANGDWLDVTPHAALDDHPFLQHAGTDQEFDAALAHGPMDHVYR